MKNAFLVLVFSLLFAGSALAADSPPAADAPPARPKLVDLGADRCVPCRMMAPILVELSKEYAGQLEVVFIDVWKNRDEGKRYGIRLIPTQIFFDAEGEEQFRHEGFFSKQEILATWEALGVTLTPPSSTEEKS